jgi:glyceraldehyde-3-phosphate dehydrogenase (NADP+)
MGFSECYTTFIPALMAGNPVILRIPRNGASPHFPTLPMYAKHFPPGVINILSGSGREIMTPLMETGGIDYLAFIGRSTSASALIKSHPEPHRLHNLLQMDSKVRHPILHPWICTEKSYRIVQSCFLTQMLT